MSLIGGVASVVTIIALFQSIEDIYKAVISIATVFLIIGLLIYRQKKSKKIEDIDLAKLNDTLQLAIYIGQIMRQSSETSLLLSKLSNNLKKDRLARLLLLESNDLLRNSILKAQEIANRLEESNQLDKTLEDIQYNRELYVNRISNAKSTVIQCKKFIQQNNLN